MRIERLNHCCGSRGNLSAVDFQPHSRQTNIHRIATSGGTYVQIWAVAKPEDKTPADAATCVLLFTYKEHSPYDVTTVRWSPNGEYLASTDSGGITTILRRNEKKTEHMESIVLSKLAGEPSTIPDGYAETTKVNKYTIKYDGTDRNRKNGQGVSRISLNSKNVQVESKEVKADSLNLLDHDNPDGNLESWEPLGTLSCPSNMGQLFDISWAPDNRSIIGGGMNGHVIVFDIHTKEIVAKFDALENSTDTSSGRGYIKSVSWDPMTLFVAVQSSNKEISIWRRSPPLPPGSPMKWTFKRVLYHDKFSERSNTDVLGGSRISWAPNGKNVVFPNSSFNSHNFSTSYQVRHNTSSFSHVLAKKGYDKNQAQYYFDTNEHTIEEEPILLKGHTARIRNVRFSRDIMTTLHDTNQERYLLLAQSSDDNMLSVWRFKLTFNTVTSVECICVLRNLLDEQSSIEDLAWGDFGRVLAVASSQGGMILIQFTHEDTGLRFHTNRIQGLNIKDMNQPPRDFFTYSDYVSSISEDPAKSDKKSDLNHNHNHTTDSTTMSLALATLPGSSRYSVNPSTPPMNVTYKEPDLSMRIWEPGQQGALLASFLIFCYRIYLLSVLYRLNREMEGGASGKRLLPPQGATGYWHFYLFNFRIEPDTKGRPPRKKHKSSKKPKHEPTQVDMVGEVWLDMDYGAQNSVVSQYWRDSEGLPVAYENEPEAVDEVSLVEDQASGDIITAKTFDTAGAKKSPSTPQKQERTGRPRKSLKSERSNVGKMSADGLSRFRLDSTHSFQDSLFVSPVPKPSLCLATGSSKFLAVNFMRASSSLTSSVASLDTASFKVHWLQHFKNGYVTHMDRMGELLAVLTQKVEGESRSYLSVLGVPDGQLHVDQLHLGAIAISRFSAFSWRNPYLVFLTTNSRFSLLRYSHTHQLKPVLNLDLSHIPKDNFLKVEFLNAGENYRRVMAEMFNRTYDPEVPHDRDLEVTERLAVLVYKKNKTVSIFSRSYGGELELDMDALEMRTSTLNVCDTRSLNLESLWRFYGNDPRSDLFGSIDFDGSLAAVLDSFSIDYQAPFREGAEDSDHASPERFQSEFDPAALRTKLEACLILGSVWEYLMYMHEYARGLFLVRDLKELVQLTSGLYCSLIKSLKASPAFQDREDAGKLGVYDVSDYPELFPYCLLFLRNALLPALNRVYSHLHPDPGSCEEYSDRIYAWSLRNQSRLDSGAPFLAPLSPSLEYQDEEENRSHFQVLSRLFENVVTWESMMQL